MGMDGRGAKALDDAVVTLAEALGEVPPRETLFWGTRLGGLAKKTSRDVPVRWIASEITPEIPGVPREVSLRPSEGAEARIAMVMPRSKEELSWRLKLAAHLLPRGAELWLAGHAREGIKSCAKTLRSLFGTVTTVRTKRHCRVLVARLEQDAPGEPSLLEHECRFTHELSSGERLELATAPGTFAHGRVDHGARAMLSVVESVSQASRVLDLGAGAGLLGGTLAKRFPEAEVDLVDHSASAFASVQRMVELNGFDASRVRAHLASVGQAPSGPYDCIVTNPPFHEGRHQNRTLVDDFADSARTRLARGGTLLLVANRHLGYADALRSRFAHVDVAQEDTRFRVWRAKGVR